MVKCKQCGNDFDEKFGVCPKCGWVYEAEEKLPEIKPPADTLPELKDYSNEKPAAKKKTKAKLFVIIGIIAAVIIAGIIIGVILINSNNGGTSEFDEQISLGEKYLSEENYDEAIAAFKKAIEIDPNDPEGYIKLADAYLAKGDTQNAISALETGYERTGSEKIKTKLEKVKNGDTSEDSEPEESTPEESSAEEVSKEEYKDPEYTLGTIVASGNCGKNGDNVKWELDENGLLVIIGNGKMKDFDYDYDTPWYKKQESIKTVIIKKGVTSIADHAFYNCTSLTSITIPDSVTSIGGWAFDGCTSLTSIYIPDSVTSIGYYAFYVTAWYNSQPDGVVYAGKVAYTYKNKGEMPANTNIVLKEGTKGIADSAFYNCTSLTSITIPESVTSIGDYAFDGWKSSQTIYIKGKSKAPSGWNKNWNENCNAKIVWNA